MERKQRLIEPLKTIWLIIQKIFVVIATVGVIAGLIADWSGLLDGVTNYFYVILPYVTILLLFIIIWQYFAYKRNIKMMSEPMNDEGTMIIEKPNLSDVNKRKYNVLIIDDQDVDLMKIKTELESGINQKKMHGVYINSIPDYRLASDFDIIISDIYGAGSASAESIGALKAVRDAYPYKIVAAMSSITNQKTKDKFGGPFLSKKRENAIKDFVETSIQELSNVENFMSQVELDMKKKGTKEEEIEIKRREFLDYLQRMKRLADN